MLIQTTPKLFQSINHKSIYFTFSFTDSSVIVYPTYIFYLANDRINDISFILHNKQPEEQFLIELAWDYDVSIPACIALYKAGNTMIDDDKDYISTITIEY